MQIGIGYDVHKLVAGRKLVIGGVVIPFAKARSPASFPRGLSPSVW